MRDWMRSNTRWPGSQLLAVAGACVALCAPSARAAEPVTGLTLPLALELAGKNNETSRIAAARIDRARAQLREAYGYLLPGIALRGTYTRRPDDLTRQSGAQTSIVQPRTEKSGVATAELNLLNMSALPLVLGGHADLNAAELDASELQRTLAFSVAETFLSVRAADAIAAAARNRYEVEQSVAADARRRAAAGILSEAELIRTELELASAELQRTEAVNSANVARLNLEYLLDADIDGPLAEPLALTEPVAGNATDAVRLRTDLRAAQAHADALRQRAHEPWFRFIPSVGLDGTYRLLDDSGDSASAPWTVSATLTWVLYDGGIRYAQAAARSAEFHEAEAGVDAKRRRIATEIEAALLSVESGNSAVRQAETRLGLARRNAQLARDRFARGMASALEQADAAATEYESEAELARQQFGLRRAQLALLDALGRWPGREDGKPEHQ